MNDDILQLIFETESFDDASFDISKFPNTYAFIKFSKLLQKHKFNSLNEVILDFQSWISDPNPPGFLENNIPVLIQECLLSDEISSDTKELLLQFIFFSFSQSSNFISSQLYKSHISQTIISLLSSPISRIQDLALQCLFNISGGEIYETQEIRSLLPVSFISEQIFSTQNPKIIFYFSRILHNFSRIRTTLSEANELFSVCSQLLGYIIEYSIPGVIEIIWSINNLQKQLKEEWINKHQIQQLIPLINSDKLFIYDNSYLQGAILQFNKLFFKYKNYLEGINLDLIISWLESNNKRSPSLIFLCHLLKNPYANLFRIEFLEKNYLNIILSYYFQDSLLNKQYIIKLLCILFQKDSFTAQMFLENNILAIFTEYLSVSPEEKLVKIIFSTLTKIFKDSIIDEELVPILKYQVKETEIDSVCDELSFDENEEIASTVSNFPYFDDLKDEDDDDNDNDDT